ncbi:type II toxin-antitoxin system VapB family antitoxin [Caulobacter vibrioides]|uniref:type II toxin-antitoxin system VapB family antitoxin n=1 Tax=Caulobacter vibrioides TaxID=155892 RepID=UPI00307912A1
MRKIRGPRPSIAARLADATFCLAGGSDALPLSATPETDALVRELAQKTKLGITEAVEAGRDRGLSRARKRPGRKKLARMDAILAEFDAAPRHRPKSGQGVLRQPQRRLMFVDASAWVAIILREPERERFRMAISRRRGDPDLPASDLGRRCGPQRARPKIRLMWSVRA